MGIKRPATDMSHYDKFVAGLNQVVAYKQQHPTTRSNLIYYEAMAKYFTQARYAHENGKLLCSTCENMIAHISRAMDVVPLSYPGLMIGFGSDEPELFGEAQALGLTSDMCSSTRHTLGWAARGALPQSDLHVFTSQVCDTISRMGYWVAEYVGAPRIYVVDRGWEYGAEARKYMAEELRGWVSTLEEITGRKMDYYRLRESIEQTKQMHEYYLKIRELMKLSPYPFRNRFVEQMFVMYQLWAGEPEAVAWLKAIYDEAMELVREGKGIIPGGERLRLVEFSGSGWGTKILEWLEQEQGVAICGNPVSFRWGAEIKWDYDNPLETLADILINGPSTRFMQVPANIFIEESLEDCISFRADVAIMWVQAYCHHMGPLVRLLKDAVAERAGIPTFIMECDIFDPIYVTYEEQKERFENILEALEDRS